MTCSVGHRSKCTARSRPAGRETAAPSSPVKSTFAALFQTYNDTVSQLLPCCCAMLSRVCRSAARSASASTRFARSLTPLAVSRAATLPLALSRTGVARAAFHTAFFDTMSATGATDGPPPAIVSVAPSRTSAAFHDAPTPTRLHCQARKDYKPSAYLIPTIDLKVSKAMAQEHAPVLSVLHVSKLRFTTPC